MDNIESIVEDKEAKMPFYSYRRVVKCYSEGISFVTNNILFLLKVYSPLFALFALFSTLMTMTFFQIVSLPAWTMLVFLPIALVVVVCVLAMQSRLFEQEALGKGFLGYNFYTLIKASRKQFLRTLSFLGVNVLVVILFALPVVLCSYFLIKGKDPASLVVPFIIVGAVAMAMFAIALFAYAIPCVVAEPYTIMERGNVLKNMWKGYKSGFKVWGKCFGLGFLVSITVVCIVIPISIPRWVMFGMYGSILMSTEVGDAIYVPSFLSWLVPLVVFVIDFLVMFLLLVAYSCYVYLYASVKADEKQQASVSKIDEI